MPKVLAAEVEAAAVFASIRFATADVSEATVYFLLATGMVTGGGDTIANVAVPTLIEAYCPTHLTQPPPHC